MTNAKNALLVLGSQPAQHVSPGQIRSGSLPRRELIRQGSGSWPKRRIRSNKSCLSHQTKKLRMGSTPHGPAAQGRTYPGGNFKDTCT